MAYRVRDNLPAALRAATHERHQLLNTQVISRLLLCLPPAVGSPLLYAQGMSTFGQIYFAFEHHLETSLASTSLDDRMRTIYQDIHIPSLARSARLRHDIESLKSRLGPDAAFLDTAADDSAFLFERVQESVAAKPHVGLAYAWIMYLALFNGGRWIRKQLVSAGPDFWRGEVLPLTFWSFEGADGVDGEGDGLKEAFKSGFVSSSILLTDDEAQDVVDEAVRIFETCLETVRHLDMRATGEASTLLGPLPSKALSYTLLQRDIRAVSVILCVWRCAMSVFAGLKTTARLIWAREAVEVT